MPPPQDPDRLALANLVTGDVLELQFNPEELTEKVEAIYARLQVQGMSHELMQYGGTKNLTMECTAKFDAATNYRGGKFDIAWARRFLMSSVYAPKSTASVVGASAPSSILFMWPNLFTMVTKLTVYSGRLWTFRHDGSLMRWDAKLTFEECRDYRLWAEDVYEQGTQRPALGPVDPSSTSANGG